jgi:hypothetical protein
MAKIINITDKLINEKPKIQIRDKVYEVNNGLNVVTKFEELAFSNSMADVTDALNVALGKKAVSELTKNKKDLTVSNLQTIILAIFAAMLDIDYEVAEARFRKTQSELE